MGIGRRADAFDRLTFAVPPDPKPDEILTLLHRGHAVLQANARGSKSSHLPELKRWLMRV
jgi:hypothetical protein